jgi:hypothetical protein
LSAECSTKPQQKYKFNVFWDVIRAASSEAQHGTPKHLNLPQYGRKNFKGRSINADKISYKNVTKFK